MLPNCQNMKLGSRGHWIFKFGEKFHRMRGQTYVTHFLDHQVTKTGSRNMSDIQHI